MNWNLFYDHCELHGRTKNICYKLVGCPEDWKFKKNNTTKNVQADKCIEEDVFGIIGERHKLMHKKYMMSILLELICRHLL